MASAADLLLELHCSLNVHLDRLGHGPTVARLRASAREIRRMAARAALADLANMEQVDPVAAVTRAAELAVQAGADWQAIAAAVNRVGVTREH